MSYDSASAAAVLRKATGMVSMVSGLSPTHARRQALRHSTEENATVGASPDKGGAAESMPALTGASDGVEQIATSDEVLRCLGKSSQDRTDDDLRVIQKATSDVKFFERLSAQGHYELCRVMTHRERARARPPTPAHARPRPNDAQLTRRARHVSAQSSCRRARWCLRRATRASPFT